MGLTLEDNHLRELQISSTTRRNTQIREINIIAHRRLIEHALFLALRNPPSYSPLIVTYGDGPLRVSIAHSPVSTPTWDYAAVVSDCGVYQLFDPINRHCIR
jgi:hypothetical protein